MLQHMTKRITVRLPKELLDQARAKAAAEGRTLSSLIEDGLWLVAMPNKKTKKRHPIPVSKATGGPMPGFEDITLSKIDELDDLEYVARMNQFKRS